MDRRKQEWEAFRNGATGIEPPFGGWVNREAQNELHEKRLQEYRDCIAARKAKTEIKTKIFAPATDEIYAIDGIECVQLNKNKDDEWVI